tara:strand:- start:4675 stop:4854 length:180 start_codon:yes stop_codon:yes gene_type:complete
LGIAFGFLNAVRAAGRLAVVYFGTLRGGVRGERRMGILVSTAASGKFTKKGFNYSSSKT